MDTGDTNAGVCESEDRAASAEVPTKLMIVENWKRDAFRRRRAGWRYSTLTAIGRDTCCWRRCE